MALERRRVVGAFVPKHGTERLEKVVAQTEPPPQHVGNFMAHMSNHGAIRFSKGLAAGSAHHWVRFGHTNGHDTVTVAHKNGSQALGKHMENRTGTWVFRSEPVPAA